MSAKTPRFTLPERQAVVEEAINLIKEPANWTTGEWKCDVWETDEKGNFIPDENGGYKRAVDFLNRPVSQYCVEGAVNQAVINVLGKERAATLGAYDEDEDDVAADEFAEITPTDILGIDELARKKHPRITEGTSRAAMALNDHYEGGNQALGHKRILSLLTDTLDLIKAKRKG